MRIQSSSTAWVVCLALATGRSAEAASTTESAISDRAAALPPAMGIWGQHGLLRSYSSDWRGQAMTLTLGTVVELSKADDVFIGQDSNTRFMGNLGVAFIPLEYLQVSLAYHMLVNSNSRTEGTLQLLGDVNLDVRGALSFRLGEGRLGLSLGPHLRFLSGSRTLFHADAFGFGFMLGATYAFPPKIPLVFHLNIGLYADNSRFLLDDFRAPDQMSASLDQVFKGFGGDVISSYAISMFKTVIPIRLAVEMPFESCLLWAEYSLDLVTGSAFPATFPERVLKFGDNPQHLSLGARLFFLPERALALGVALDFGFTGHLFPHDFGVPRQVPVNIIATLGFTFGRSKPTVVKTIIKEAPPPKVTKGSLLIMIVDDKSGRQVGDAEVKTDRSKQRHLAGKSDGVVRLVDVEEGSLTVRVEHPFYEPSGKKSTTIMAGKTVELEIRLSRLVGDFGILEGQVTNISGDPIPKASVSIGKGQFVIECDSKGRFAKQLQPDKYQVEISAAGHISDIRIVEIKNGTKSIHDVSLHKSSPQLP